jgi:N6-L-threonylcarbamoyladenine synthase
VKQATMAIYLGVETSCDETAAAVVKDGRQVLSNCLFSQTRIHEAFGGVVPEVAAREHLETINFVIENALSDAALTKEDLNGIGCTLGPGLIGTLLVGIAAARSLSWAWDLPFIGVDHLHAHVCANFLDTELEPPFVCLLVSGGHTQIIHVESFSRSQIIGQTVDDACGEAFDKVARLLGLGYPGGPAIDLVAKQGDPSSFKFPEAKMSHYDFSFSGLKTAVLRRLEKLAQPWPVADVAASFQEAIVTVLVRKLVQAQRDLRAPAIALAGGVAANSRLRSMLLEVADIPVFLPSLRYCTDNAAMVASAAFFSSRNTLETEQVESAYSRSKVRRRRALGVEKSQK